MPSQKIAGISVAEFAREMKVANNTVRDRVKSGRMAKAVLPDGSLDPELARVLWFANTNPNRTRMRSQDKRPQSALAREAEDAEPKGSEYDLKVRRMAVDLEAAEIGLETLRKTTINRREALRATRALMRLHRNTLLNFASRYGPEIAAECGCDERKMIGALEARMRLALVDAANQPIPFDEDAPPADDDEAGDEE